jgi:hypothetical protein
MIKLNGLAFLFLMSWQTVAAAEESVPDTLFQGVTCEHVRHRAGAVMIGRTGGLSYREALQHVRKSNLDQALIDDAYKVPVPLAQSGAFEVWEAFISDWGLRCDLAKDAQ